MSQVCSALREELESQNQQRMDALNKKFIPLVVTDEPSRKANYKISAMRVLYELHSLKQRRAFMNLRAEIEEGNRVKVESEVSILKVSCLDLILLIQGAETKRKDLRPKSSSYKYHKGNSYLTLGCLSKQVQSGTLSWDI